MVRGSVGIASFSDFKFNSYFILFLVKNDFGPNPAFPSWDLGRRWVMKWWMFQRRKFMMMDLSRNWRPTLKQFLGDSPWNLTASLFYFTLLVSAFNMLFLTCHPRLCLWRTWENISLQLSPQQTEDLLRQADSLPKKSLCSRYVGIHFPVGHQEGDSSSFESPHHSYPNQDWWELLDGIGMLWLQCKGQEWMWGGVAKKTNKKPSDVLDICFRFDLNFGFQVHFSFMFCKSFGFIFYPADFPPNTQFKVHWREFLREGYKPHYGALMVKFPDWSRDGSRAVQQGSVGLVDGQTKLLIMLSIVSFVAELELSEADCEHPILKATLASFASIYCSFTHYDHPGHYFLQSLRCLTSDWVSNSIFVFCDVCFFALLCFSTNLSQFLAHCHI